MDLGNLIGGLTGGDDSGNKKDLLSNVVSMVGGQEGLQNLVGQLSKGGLGSAVQSWIGTGTNEAVSGTEIEQALGKEQVSQIANQAGVSNDEASSGLASMLPSLIDKISPDGKLPSGDQLNDVLGGLKGMLGGH